MKWVSRLFFICFYGSLLYGTAYWFALAPEQVQVGSKPALIGRVAKYSLSGEWVEQAFGLAHWVDRQARPGFWGWSPARTNP